MRGVGGYSPPLPSLPTPLHHLTPFSFSPHNTCTPMLPLFTFTHHTPPLLPILHLPPLHNCTLLGVTKALRNMNKRLNLPQLQKIMMQFERESEIMDLKEETISDTIDDVIGEEDEDEVGLVITCNTLSYYMHTHSLTTCIHTSHKNTALTRYTLNTHSHK